MTGLTILMAFGFTSSPVDAVAQTAQEDARDPAQVTDLIVSDGSGTSRTLSFTQVDDGTGHPADYVVRFQIAPVDGTPAAEVVYGSCAAPVQGTSIGARISCTVDNLLPENTYAFQVAAFRGTFRGKAVYGALSNVVPDVKEPAPPRSRSHANEPAGYSIIASSPFPCVPDLEGYCADTGDWSTNSTPNLATVDLGENRVLRTRFPAGLKPGTGPVNLNTWDKISRPTPMKELYVSHQIRLVSGENDGLYEFYSGTNKLGFWGTQAPGGVPSDLVVLCHPPTQGAGTGQLEDHCRLRMVQQNNVDRGVTTSTDIYVDTWHHWEFQFVLNDPANNYVGEDRYGNPRTHGDGIFRWWQDGKLILELTDVAFATDTSHGFYTYRWNPTWGGGSEHEPKVRTDYIHVDDLYISGIPK